MVGRVVLTQSSKRASSYEAEEWLPLLKQITEELRTHLNWIGVPWIENEPSGRQVRMLDYACGPGMASKVRKDIIHSAGYSLTCLQALLPYVTQVRGIDVAGAMVEEYNRRAKAEGLEPEVISAARGDLTDTSASIQYAIEGPEFFEFDLAVVSMAFHHFEYPEVAARKLVERLKVETGVLLIIDLVEDSLPFPGHGHGHDHGHGHTHVHTHDHEHDAGREHIRNHADDQNSQDQGDAAIGVAQRSSEADVLGTVAHSGFGKEGLEKIFREVGLVDIDYISLERPLKFGNSGPLAGQEKRLFMARGRRAAGRHSEL